MERGRAQIEAAHLAPAEEEKRYLCHRGDTEVMGRVTKHHLNKFPCAEGSCEAFNEM